MLSHWRESQSSKNTKLRSQAGQVAVEYVLLLAVGVTIWLIVMNGLVSRNPNSPGIVIQKWMDLVRMIGEDKVE